MHVKGLYHCGGVFWKDLVSIEFVWRSEARRVFISGLARIRDAEWLQGQLHTIHLSESSHMCFS